MKTQRACCLICLCGAAVSASPSSPILMPDSQLRAVLEEKLGAAPTAENMLSLSELTTIGRGITDLRGLEHAKRLAQLRLDNNQIQDLAPLASLKELKDLWLPGNRIESIAPLAGLTNLERLFLYQNQIQDITPLAGLVRLQGLSLYSNAIEDVNAVKRLQHLEFLWLGANRIRDLSPLSALTRLPQLSLYANRVRDLTPLAKLTQLKMLELQANEIHDLTPLAELASIETLALQDNRISSVAPLSGLRQLTRLYLGNNAIRDVAPLAGLNALRALDLSENQIQDVTPLLGLGSLSQLSLPFNPLRALPAESRLAQWLRVAFFEGDPEEAGSADASFRTLQLEVDVEQCIRLVEAPEPVMGTVLFPEEITGLIVRRLEPFSTPAPGERRSRRTEPVVLSKTGRRNDPVLHLPTATGSVRLPVGKYQVVRWEIERADAAGNVWQLEATTVGDNGAFAIRANEPTRLEIGEPLTVRLEFQRRARDPFSFQHVLAGPFNEQIRLRRNVCVWKAPSLRIVSGDGQYDRSFTFSYG